MCLENILRLSIWIWQVIRNITQPNVRYETQQIPEHNLTIYSNYSFTDGIAWFKYGLVHQQRYNEFEMNGINHNFVQWGPS